MLASTMASNVPCTSCATKPGKSTSLTSAPVRPASDSVAAGLGCGGAATGAGGGTGAGACTPKPPLLAGPDWPGRKPGIARPSASGTSS